MAATSTPSLELAEYAKRREALCRTLKNAVGVVFAGDQAPHLEHGYRPHPHFEYLTGITDEPGAALVLDPTSPVKARQAMVFLKPLNPEVEKWDGYRLEVGKALRDRVGMQAVFRTEHLPRFLADAARRAKRLACLHPLANHAQPVSPDLEVFNKLAARIPGIAIDDASEAIAAMRAVKSKGEIAMVQHAVNITAAGFDAVAKAVSPGMNEFDVQEVIEHAYRTNGARETSFQTIAGAGVNSTVLHYHANDQTLEDGDLILIDSGAAFCGYRGDITRTYPVNGTFTKRQREVYDIVLRAQEAAIKAAKPGVRLSELDKVARDIITKAGYGDNFIHGLGHHLGLETHDVTPDAPLKAGAIITIEPGIYLADEKIGIRIEDDIVITDRGAKNLSKAIPKKADDIEALMQSR